MSSVGIVLVSHSDRLATGLRDLIRELIGDKAPVAVAGGTDDGGMGTSYDLVVSAIGAADQGAGVVVLPDIGSSVLTMRTVEEDHPRDDVVLVDAPFVEGAVSAAVIAASGADLATVVAAGEEARRTAKF
ncbi:dihydroxyacetone kinase phosphotransfer subunit [Lipingzhangella halophila]|uniref:phosphoenolpyruvate--glycerone phosphotransferase n=1 Tax=Lipingzhangella halophila TaxID=1783352 RepID=A0A7W7RII5_9ACTN|nr:dihydroxyacetone kinase phosphoryl donor subunit DhaM [Lipingzhangella halophila]MBB4932613.1 dihydroxyacetone kinase phosphotransfer subunit [Lipingzhangella halophila]